MASESAVDLAQEVIDQIGDESFVNHLLENMSDPELIGHVQHIAEEEDIDLEDDGGDDDLKDGEGGDDDED